VRPDQGLATWSWANQ